MPPYRFNKEARLRYEHYKKHLFEQYMTPARERNKRLRDKGTDWWKIPSLSGAIWTSEERAKKQAKKQAKKMVKWDKKMARLNRWKLSETPRTEWAENPYD